LAWAARNTLRQLSAEELRETARLHPDAGVERIHHLIEGIFKPEWSQLPLTIWSTHALSPTSDEPYSDRLQYSADGVWFLDYKAKGGPLESAVNRGLRECAERREPVIVILSEPSASRQGRQRYRLQGVGLVTGFDPQSRTFRLSGFSVAEPPPLGPPDDSYGRELLLLRSRLANEFAIHEARPLVASLRKDRDRALRKLVLHEYACQCAVCRAEFQLREPPRPELVEAQAAHIVPVEEDGSDDLRNTLALCPRHHWSFDKGLFMVDDARRVRVSPAVARARQNRFDLAEYEGRDLLKPNTTGAEPDDAALNWHRVNRFLAS
jgi:hypothetical protein